MEMVLDVTIINKVVYDFVRQMENEDTVFIIVVILKSLLYELNDWLWMIVFKANY